MTSSSHRDLSTALRAFPGECRAVLGQFPHLAVFGVFLVAWLALFQFFGNSTLGYVNTTSLFGWMEYAYWGGQDDRVGYLVPFLVLGLLWWRREELAAVPKRTWWPGLMLVALALAIHVLGFIIQQTRLSVVAFFVGLWLLTGVVWGPAWLRASFFPFCLLAFAVPLGNAAERITFPLRLLATQISVGVAYYALGIDVIRTGTSILDSTGRYQYEVAAACSGIRSLTAILALTVIYAFMSFRSPGRRLVILASAFPLAVAGNVLRLLAIILAAEAFGQEAGNRVHDSTWFSLVPYVPSVLGLVLLGGWLKEEPREVVSTTPNCRPTNQELIVIGVVVAAAIAGADTATGRSVTERLVWLAADIALTLSTALAGLLLWVGVRSTGAALSAWPGGLVAATLLLLTLGGWSGLHLQRIQHLGAPGVLVVAEPIYGQDSRAEEQCQAAAPGAGFSVETAPDPAAGAGLPAGRHHVWATRI
jgi:exosortase